MIKRLVITVATAGTLLGGMAGVAGASVAAPSHSAASASGPNFIYRG